MDSAFGDRSSTICSTPSRRFEGSKLSKDSTASRSTPFTHGTNRSRSRCSRAAIQRTTRRRCQRCARASARARARALRRPRLRADPPAAHATPPPQLEFVHADATSSAWSNADVAFIHATSFDEALLQTLAVMGKQMRKGSFMITYTHQCPSVEFVLCEPAAVFSASHGEILVYIHQKASHPR